MGTTHWHSLQTVFFQQCCLLWYRHRVVLTMDPVRYPCCPPSQADGAAVPLVVAVMTLTMRRQDRRRPLPHYPGSGVNGEPKQVLPLPPPAHQITGSCDVHPAHSALNQSQLLQELIFRYQASKYTLILQ